MKTIEEIKSVIRSNQQNGRSSYYGLESAEIGAYNRYVMYGENDKAFPSQSQYSRIVD